MSQPRICLVALIGLPAAGKSSFCRWLLQSSLQANFQFIHFCYDEFLEFYQLPINPTAMDFLYKAQRQKILEILLTLIKALETGRDFPLDLMRKIKMSSNQMSKEKPLVILCDDNHYYPSMRYKLYQLCKAKSYFYGQVYFDCDEKLSLERNSNRNRIEKVPNHVIKQMAERLQPPSEDNSWENLNLTIETENLSFSHENVNNFLRKVFERKFEISKENLVKEVHQGSDGIDSSLIHKLDNLLRKRVGEILSNECKEDKKVKALLLNEKRKEILQQIRSCEELKETNLCEYVEMLS